jgi:hypothetical protein
MSVYSAGSGMTEDVSLLDHKDTERQRHNPEDYSRVVPTIKKKGEWLRRVHHKIDERYECPAMLKF